MHLLPTTRRPLAGRRAWIIGASSGIGAALAHELDRRGAQVAVSARRPDLLEEVAAGRMAVVPVDVTDADGLVGAADQVRQALGGLDLVVYAAGVWEQTDATAWEPAALDRHVAVHLGGLSTCLAAVLPPMLEAGEGQIVGISSVAGYRGIAGAEAYGAVKAAQINLLESLRASLGRRGIAVTTVCPGFVRTPLTDRNAFPMPFLIEADQAARAICDGVERGQVEIVFPFPMALLMKAARLLPVRVWAALASQLAHRTEERAS